MARIRKAESNPAPEILTPAPEAPALSENPVTPDTSAPEPEAPRRGRPPGSKTRLRAVEPPAPKIGPEILSKLFIATGTLEARLLAGRLGVPVAVAEQAFIPQDPLLSMLSDSAAAVLAKYNIGGRYADEIVLVSMLVMWQTSALQNVRAYAAVMKEQHATRDNLGTAASGEVHPGAGAGDQRAA